MINSRPVPRSHTLLACLWSHLAPAVVCDEPEDETLRAQWARERVLGKLVLSLAELCGLSAVDLSELEARLDRDVEPCAAWP